MRFAEADDDVRAHMANAHVLGPRLYTLLERENTDPRLKSATLQLLGKLTHSAHPAN